LLDRFVYTGNPEPPEVALPVFPSGMRVFTRMEIRLGCHADKAAFRHPVAFIGPEYIFMSFFGLNAPFNSHKNFKNEKIKK
jgi:hypothetical protein